MSEIVESFMRRYRKEYDFYEKSARKCADQLDDALTRNAIRAIVTFRAKKPTSLRTKLLKRNESKNYQNHDEIFNDLVDLAGVRVAIYFPGDKSRVAEIIQELFSLRTPKIFPDKLPSTTNVEYTKRFSGYKAVHYRVNLSTDDRYSVANIEIQVASVLMHAWSEVEHDLVYKPQDGQISSLEHSILDQINGLVIAGEIALENLQNALKSRLENTTTTFSNHYELGGYLYEKYRKKWFKNG